jgi:cob(I)alamin adenosyltransferase
MLPPRDTPSNFRMSPTDLMHAIDTQLAHVWMVRAFVKHSEEAGEDEELAEVHRELYDFMLAVGGPFKEGNAEEYLRLAGKKFGKLKRASELFERIQPEVSQHTNFFMAVASLKAAVGEVGRLLAFQEGESRG